MLVGSGSGAKDISGDGRWVLGLEGGERPRIVLVPTGAGQPTSLETPAMNIPFLCLSADARQVIFTGNLPGHALRTYIQDVSGGPPRPLTPEGIAWCPPDGRALSPDAKSIVVRDPEGKALLWSVDGGKPREISGFDSRSDSVWQYGTDGRSLLVGTGSEVPVKLCRLEIETGKRDGCVDLAPANRTGVVVIDEISVTPDARAYAYAFIRRSCDLYVVDGLK